MKDEEGRQLCDGTRMIVGLVDASMGKLGGIGRRKSRRVERIVERIVGR